MTWRNGSEISIGDGVVYATCPRHLQNTGRSLGGGLDRTIIMCYSSFFAIVARRSCGALQQLSAVLAVFHIIMMRDC
jgi:hypothetical protein